MTLRMLGLFCLLWLVGSLPGQDKDFNLDLGPEYFDSYLSGTPTVVGQDGSGYFVFQNKQEGVWNIFSRPEQKLVMRKFGRNLAPLREVEIDLGQEVPQTALLAEGRLHLFSSLVDKRTQQNVLLHREVDRNTLNFARQGNALATISYAANKDNRFIDFHFRTSRDSSKILVYFSIPTQPHQREEMAVMVFDDAMQMLWERHIVLPYVNDLFDFDELRVSNDGQVFLLGKHYQGTRKDRRKGRANYGFKLLQMKKEVPEPVVKELKFGDQFLYSMQMDAIRQHDVVCAGIWGGRRANDPKGIYFFTMDPETSEIKEEGTVELTSQVLDAAAATFGRSKKGGRITDLEDFRFTKLIGRADGGAILIGEFNYVTEVRRRDFDGFIRSYYTFYSDDILALNINPDGSIQGISAINKRQRMSDDNTYLSHGVAVTRNRVRFVFNDRIENLNPEARRRPKDYAPSVSGKGNQIVHLVSWNGGKLQESQPMTTVEEAGLFAIPRSAKQVSPNEIIMVFERGKRRRLGRITFP